jgi:ribosome maturation factor RimP
MAQDTAVIRRCATTVAAAAGLDLVDVVVKDTGRQTIVRVVVDRKGGVDVGTCQQLSRDLSGQLDVCDPISGRYSLEVTSPGTDRPLRTQRDFDRVEGRLVRLRRQAGDGVAELRGTVREARDDAVVLDVDGSPVAVPYVEVDSARQALPW